MPAFDVTASPTKLSVKPGTTTPVKITVNNRLGKEVLARAQAVINPPSAANFVIAPPDAQRKLPAGSQSATGATSDFEFQVVIPQGTLGRSFTMRVDVVEVGAQDDNFGQSDTVGVTVIEEAKPVPPPNNGKWWVWVIAAVVVLAVAVGLWLVLRPKDNKIPDLAKKRKPDAMAMIDTSKIVAVWVDTLNGDTLAYKAAMVIEQKPAAGTLLKGVKGVKDTLRLTVQKSYSLVPRLVGLVPTDAATKLGMDSLLLGVSNDCRNTHTPEEGKVVKSNPDEGALVARGTSVNISVRVFAPLCFHISPAFLGVGALIKANSAAVKAARVPR